jgi:hypothetical protein
MILPYNAVSPIRPTLLEKKQLLLLSKNFSGQALRNLT